MDKLEVLNQDEIRRIHETTIDLLQEIGIKIESAEALNLFENYGVEMDKAKQIVYIPEDLIKKKLRSVPKEFSLYGPDGSYKVNVNTNTSVFATMGAATNIYDPNTRKSIRKTTIKDAIEHIRVVNELDNINSSHVDVWPHDIPFTEIHYHSIYNWAYYGSKPYGMSCYGRVASKDMIELLSIIVDGFENLENNPRLIGIFNPLSPLCLPQILLNGLFIFAKYKQPILISAAASAGSTSPVTLAGTLVQANMEVLATIILTQLINPQTPILYGSTNTILDPLTGNVAYGSIEFSLLTIASAQMAQFYKLPSKGSGCLTDSKCFDLQNGFERFFTLFSAMAAGHNYITCAGTYESLLSEAMELLIIDDRSIGLLKNVLNNYNNTIIKMKDINELNSLMKTIWKSLYNKNILEEAKCYLKQILENKKRYGLKSKVEKELNNYYKTIASRSLEDYQKLEGLENSNKGINIGGIDVNK